MMPVSIVSRFLLSSHYLTCNQSVLLPQGQTVVLNPDYWGAWKWYGVGVCYRESLQGRNAL